jgi:hypothetical protein
MPQVTNGIFRGAPGPVGSLPCIDFCEVTTPDLSTDPQVNACANGSTYSNVNGGTNTTFFVRVNSAWIAVA